MVNNQRTLSLGLIACLTVTLLSLTACDDSPSDVQESIEQPSYTIGGTITGLESDGLELTVNESETLEVSGARFEFSTALEDGNSYQVSIVSNPDKQRCTLENASGTVSGTNVSNIEVICIELYTIGGTVTGLKNDGLELANNGADTLEVAGTSFEFPTALEDVSAYQVSIVGNPDQQLCSLDNASGTVAGDDVDNVEVLCRYWRSSGEINSGTSNDLQIAADHSGNAIAVWDSYDQIYAIRFDADNGIWGSTELIGSKEGTYDPEVVFDASGDAIAVWKQAGNWEYNLYASRFSADTGQWGAAEQIENSDEYAGKPKIAIDSSGNIIAVWRREENDIIDIYAKRYSADSDSWSAREKINVTGGNAADAQIDVDESGNAIVVWRQRDGTIDDIYANRFIATDGSWGTAELIESGSGDARDPKIAVDSSGSAIAVWGQKDSSDREYIHANRFSVDSGWGSAEVINPDADGIDINPPAIQVAVDASDNVIAVWQQIDWGTSIDSNLYANRFSDGSWGTAEPIESSSDSAYSPQMVVDPSGNVIVVWVQDGDDIYSSRFSTVNDSWSTPGPIEQNSGEVRSPQIALDPSGNAIALWSRITYNSETRNSSYYIYANRFE
ncbi:MAG: hypothetical protein ACQES2_08175 [Pseudomonadota bacterium]